MTKTTIEYANLTLWSHPADYGGANWYGWYPVLGQSRDSDALTRSNYASVLAELKELDTELAAADIDPRADDSEGDSTVTDTRCGHWACGWVETIYVHSSNIKACERANEILGALEDYPVHDEELFSATEHEDESNSWVSWAKSDFVRAVARELRDSEQLHVPDYAGPHVEHCQCDECTDEQLELLTDDDVYELFTRACDATNTYWVHESDGASIDVDRVAARVSWSDIEHLIAAHPAVIA